MSKFVLRSYRFGYNDETYYVCGTRINSVHDDRAEVDAAYRKLQIEYLRDLSLGEHTRFFDGDDAYIKEMDAFVHERTGQHITGDGGYVEFDAKPHAKLSDDDLFEFGEKGELFAYKIIEFPDEPVFYALWNTYEDKWLLTVDESFEGLVYRESRDALIEQLEEPDYYLFDFEEREIDGTPETLSDTPGVLRQFIEKSREMNYDEEAEVLRLECPDMRQVVALNELLKQPLFEIRELDIDELRAAEEGLEDNVLDWGDLGDDDESLFAGCAMTTLKVLSWIAIALGIVTALRCFFGTCENVVDTFVDTAVGVLKWTFIAAVGIVAAGYGLYRWRKYARKKK